MGGGDWDENAEQLAAENAKLDAVGGGATVQMTVSPDEKDYDEGGDEE